MHYEPTEPPNFGQQGLCKDKQKEIKVQKKRCKMFV